MIIIEFILVFFGAFVTFFSEKVAKAILKNKRKPNEADIVYTKLVGFASILAATLMVFV